MKKKSNVAVIGTVISSLLSVMPLAAQVTPPAAEDAFGILNGYNFDAVQTESVESKTSQGLFTSDVDDFIGVNDYNPAIGTFLFLGGNAAAVPGVHLGFGKTLKSGYLGVYYGGSLVSASGTNNGADAPVVDGESTWRNNLALIFANNSIGAIRLDLIVNAESKSHKVDGDKVDTAPSTSGNYSTSNATTLALTWGKNSGKLSPHATVGFQFPDYTLNSDGDKKTTTWENAAIYLKAGAGIALNDTSSLDVDVLGVLDFGESKKGDFPADVDQKTAGPMAFAIPVSYTKTVAMGENAALKIQPNVRAGLQINDPNKSGDLELDTQATTNFGLQAGIKAGVKFRLPGKLEKLTLYTGINLRLLDWETYGLSGGDGDPPEPTSWSLSGIAWNTSTLDIGVVWKPTESLTIGLDGLLTPFFTIDANTMKFQSNAGTWDNIWDPIGAINVDLTVSYKF